MNTKKAMFVLLMVLCAATFIQAQSKGTIVYTILQDTAKVDPETGEFPDMPFIHLLRNEGYNVIMFYNDSISIAAQATWDTLDNANLIILGRSTPSLDYGNSKEAWNGLTTPIMCLEMWALRNNRLNWFNSTNIPGYTDADSVYGATITEPDDPVFEGLDTSAPFPWMTAPVDVMGVTDAGNGLVLARMAVTEYVLFVRFEPDFEFYDGSNDFPAGPRTVIGNGRDVSGKAPFHYFTFTEQSEKVFLAEVARMVALGGGSAVKDRGNAARTPDFVLSQNYPNPFNPTTAIPFDLAERSHVRLTLNNILGEEIREMADGEYGAGHHEIVLDAGSLAAGVYFYKIETEKYAALKKLAIVK
jgi:hypothetical protein